MDDFEEIIQVKSDDFENILNFKDNIAVIFCFKDVLYVHTNIFKFKRRDRSIESSAPSQLSLENDSAQVYEVTKITRKLDWDEIK